MSEEYWKDPVESPPMKGSFLCLVIILPGPGREPDIGITEFFFEPRKGWLHGSNINGFEVVKYISIEDLDKLTCGNIANLKQEFYKKIHEWHTDG